MSYRRFAVYYLAPEGPLAQAAASWLGWDVDRGCALPQPDVPGLQEITQEPGKYGFHGTLKPPFRLAEGRCVEDLVAAVAELAAGLAPVECTGLELATLGRFLALVPRGGTQGLGCLAECAVRDLDRFRAPISEAELARRRKARLTARQEEMLARWGYPHVLEEFRFHMTLTGSLARRDLPRWHDTLLRHLPPLPVSLPVAEIALCGEREDGRFERVFRYRLGGRG